jgi:hypothetical protein
MACIAGVNISNFKLYEELRPVIWDNVRTAVRVKTLQTGKVPDNNEIEQMIREELEWILFSRYRKDVKINDKSWQYWREVFAPNFFMLLLISEAEETLK